MSVSSFLVRSQIDGCLLFQDLPEETRASLADIAEVKRFEERDVLIAEGDVNEELFLLVTGKVNVWTSDEGVVVELKELGPGNCFGEVGFLTEQPATATIDAIEPGMALIFPRETTKPLIQDHPKIAEMLQHLTLNRAMDTIRKITGD